ncbi:MAG TPA: acyl carrier protein [Bryobacteraceae bacterium]|jgi:acyl carrier protein|nr:acyl carrier protein [Bryobacteraceae bacterium]
MDEQTQRLMTCFRTVFGDLSDADLLNASMSTVAGWDSVASITLVNVIEEEFQMQFDYDAIPDLTSFDAVAKYMQANNGAHA